MAQTYNFYWGGVASESLTPANLALVHGDIVYTPGVVRGSGGGTACRVDAPVSGLSVTVNPGDWFSSGYFGQSTGGTVSLSIASNSSGSNRDDAIVAQLDLVAGTASFIVIQGTPGSGLPALTNNSSLQQIMVAYVNLPPSTANITAAMITDTRTYATPLLHGPSHAPGGADPGPVNLRWPEGLFFGPTGASVAAVGANILDLGPQTLAGSGGTYTVPANYTLYVTRVFSSTTTPGTFQIKHSSGGTYVSALSWATSSNNAAALHNPLIVQGGGLLLNNTTSTMTWWGYLVPASGKLTGLSITLTTGGSPVTYPVPANTWFVLTHVYAIVAASLVIGTSAHSFAGFNNQFGYVNYGGAGAVTIGSGLVDGTSYQQAPLEPLLIGAGVTLSALTANVAIHGYLWPQTG